MSGPTGLYSNGTKLYVVDRGNNRVLVWNTMPTNSGQAASFALGQPNLTSNAVDNGRTSASSMHGPTAVHSDGTRLFVTDNYNKTSFDVVRSPNHQWSGGHLRTGANKYD